MVVCVTLRDHQITNRCKIEHENAQRWQLCICLELHSASFLFALVCCWWFLFLVAIIFILIWFFVFVMKISPVSRGSHMKLISWVIISLHYVTNIQWRGTGKSTQKHMLPSHFKFIGFVNFFFKRTKYDIIPKLLSLWKLLFLYFVKTLYNKQ